MPPSIVKAEIDDACLTVWLSTGETVAMPISSVPTLMLATAEERQRMTVHKHSLSWDDLDCDLSVEGLLSGAKELPGLAQKAWDRFFRKQYERVA